MNARGVTKSENMEARDMNRQETVTTAGKWSVALGLVSSGGIVLCLAPFFFAVWSAEARFLVIFIFGIYLIYGLGVVTLTSLIGAGVGAYALRQTRWRQGRPGLGLNVCVLALCGTFFGFLYVSAMNAPDSLVWAAGKGRDRTVKRLLAKGRNVNQQTLQGDTPLTMAAGRGYDRVVETLLAHGADVNIGDPIERAAYSGNTAIVKMLLEHGADPNCVAVAVSQKQEEVVSLLLDHGANVNGMSKYGETPLHNAVARGSERIVRLLLARGADVRAQNRGGGTPLHCLVGARTHPEWAKGYRGRVMDMLLDAGADIEAKSRAGSTPLEVAANTSYCKEAVRLLLARGANPDNVKDLHLRFIAGPNVTERSAIEEWVRRTAKDVNAKNGRGESMLHAAVKGGSLRLVEVLLALGADVKASTYQDQYPFYAGDTPLHWAMIEPEPEIVNLLIAKGAAVNARNKKGETALHILARPLTIIEEQPLGAEKREVFLALLASGAGIGIRDNSGTSSWDQISNWLPESTDGREYQRAVLSLMREYRD